MPKTRPTPEKSPFAAMTVTQEQVLDALRQVQDPDLHKDIVALGFITKNEVSGGSVDVVINLTTPACPVKDLMKDQADKAIRAIPGVTKVKIEMTAEVRGGSGPPRQIAPNIRHIIAITSGKGGVGKSTVTVNLACALAKTGAKVGILDCDVYGPDIPMMMGLEGMPENIERKLKPKENFGVKTMSVGYLVPADKPTVWRGPMVHKLIEQFLADVLWGELDYLLVDMPPGTGDAQLSLAQIVPLTGAVLVTTPQAVSTFDVGKAIAMFDQVNVKILGIVENMAGYVIRGKAAPGKLDLEIGDDMRSLEVGEDGAFETVVNLFGEGGAQGLSARHGFPILGQIPLNPVVRVGGDGGAPITITNPDSVLSGIFADVAGKMAQRVAIREHASLPVLQ